MSTDRSKQVIVVRKDLKMPIGKFGAQVSHAAMAFMTRGLRSGVIKPDPYTAEMWYTSGCSQPAHTTSIDIRSIVVDEEMSPWIDGSFTKAIVSVNSEEELLDIYKKAANAGLRHTLITDEGRTVFGGVPTHTCVAVGPNYVERVNAITGHLPLYR